MQHGDGATADGIMRVARPKTAAGRSWPRGLAALQYRNYRLLWTGALVSNVGTWLQTVAQGWLVLQLANSAFVLGLVNAIGMLPIMTLSLYGGVLADRVDRRKLLIIAEIALMMSALAMAGLTEWHLITINWLLVLVALIGVASALSSPAWMAFISELVPAQGLMNAIALNSAQFNVARVLGPAFAGTMIAIVGVAGCFTLNGLSFLAVIATLVAIRLPARRQPESRPSPWRSLVDGLRYVAHHPEARAVLALTTIHTVFGMPFLMLMPVFARNVFHGNAGDLGVLLSAMGIGAVGGALTTARLGSVQRRGLLILGMEVAFAVALLLFANMPTRLLALPALALVGFWMVSFFTTANTILQILSGDEMRGRMMSLWTIASWGVGPIGSLWAGALAANIGARATVSLGACICLLAVVAMGLTSPLLRIL
ncbi:MAG: putative major facilitator superfamily transporter [Chloroflexi bacterium]|jgi:MFS family permease|nr:putative major facilitator superfamily transporter [Chloroflexota bacterium]